MDINHIIDALKSTTNTEKQSQATDYLNQVSSLIGFSHILLRIIKDEQLECAVRQAAVIYFKNTVYEHWHIDDDDKAKNWELSEQDKELIKQEIMSTIIHAPEPIRIHLSTAIQNILRHDFPDRWLNFSSELVHLLHGSEGEILLGALLVMHRLCKIYEYKRQKEKTPIVELMSKILPLLRERLFSLNSNQTRPSCIIQKQILKIFFCLTQFSLNTQILSVDQFAKWLHCFIEIIQRPLPIECESLPEDERSETIWWKCKKWAVKIIQRVFERYGNKGNVDKPYVAFAEEYSKSMVLPVVNTLLINVLNSYVEGKYISESVLYLTLSHLSDALNQAQVWQIVKPQFEVLVKNIIFPLLQHSKEDDELWTEDWQEFLRYKYNVYEELHQPSSAASTLLQMICKRQGVLQPVLQFILDNLSPISTAHQIDGSLHMIAIISSQLLKTNKYKKDVEKLIDVHVAPRTEHESRFVRMRACYVLHFASETPYKSKKILERIINALVKRLREDNELPVKVEAAIALQSLLNDQGSKGVSQIIKPYIKDILIIVLKLVAETHVDDLPTVVDTLVENFEDEVVPIAYDISAELVNIFDKMVKSEDNDGIVEDNSVSIMGILTTLETILGLVEEHPEIIKKVEPIIRRCIVSIFECYCENYFEEALSLTHTLIVVTISPEMWTVYDLIYKAFQEEGTAFFSDCMPVFHAFLTVDTANFLSVPERINYLLSMCEKTICDQECDESNKAHAAKMLEVFLLQCRGHVNHFIPNIVRLIFSNFAEDTSDSTSLNEFKLQLMMVLIAALYTDFNLCVGLFDHFRMDPTLNTFEWIIRRLYANRSNIEGIHDRKMLIWLLCTLISDGNLPILFQGQSEKIMLWLLNLFDDLQRCLKELAERSKDDDDSDDDESTSDEDNRMNGELKDSEDDVDEENMEYLEALEREAIQRRQRRTRQKSNTDGSMSENKSNEEFETSSETNSEDFHHFKEETDFEAFTTPLDEQDDSPGLNVFLLFKRTFENLKEQNPSLFSTLSGQEKIGSEKVVQLQKLIEVCVREENLERSRQLAQSGGYSFDTTQPVPSMFKFG